MNYDKTINVLMGLSNTWSAPSMDSFILTNEAQSHIKQKINNASTSHNRASFPKKLHSILCDPKYEKAITWLPDGCSWKVLDQERLKNEVLPHYFDHNNYTSFMRQVNAYGFQRKSGKKCESIYYHKVINCDNNKFQQSLLIFIDLVLMMI